MPGWKASAITSRQALLMIAQTLAGLQGVCASPDELFERARHLTATVRSQILSRTVFDEALEHLISDGQMKIDENGQVTSS